MKITDSNPEFDILLESRTRIGGPDILDVTLVSELSRMRHERRMKEIREMDVEEWAREHYHSGIEP